MYNISEATMVNEYCLREVKRQRNEVSILSLRHAIQNDELSVDYQPRFDTITGQTSIFEALVRWRQKDGSTIYPDEFINMAIKQGLIYSLDLWVFKKCCADLIWLREHVNENINIAVNISPVECESLHHMQKLIETCYSYGLVLSDFEFEITESAHIHDIRKIRIFCETMIELGASVSLDDFGTCFSPLYNLCELPINYIKIDKIFTKNIGSRGRSDILISHLIELAHEMRIKVVAEGVENAYQRDHLINMRCDQVQGFYMCKPLNPPHISVNHMNM